MRSEVKARARPDAPTSTQQRRVSGAPTISLKPLRSQWSAARAKTVKRERREISRDPPGEGGGRWFLKLFYFPSPPFPVGKVLASSERLWSGLGQGTPRRPGMRPGIRPLGSPQKAPLSGPPCSPPPPRPPRPGGPRLGSFCLPSRNLPGDPQAWGRSEEKGRGDGNMHFR